MRLPESVTKIQPVGAVLKASEAGEALLREAGERVNARLLVGQADAAGLSRWEREYSLADRSGEDGARRRARIYAAMAGMAALCEAIARQKGAHLTVTAVPCAVLTLDRAETLHGGALELA